MAFCTRGQNPGIASYQLKLIFNPGGARALKPGRDGTGKRGRKRKHRDRVAKLAWQREWRLRRYYGISLAEARALMESQGSRCAVCREAFIPSRKRHVLGLECVIDHIDTAGGPVVRGILCNACNISLGLLRDDPAILERARAYLLERGGRLTLIRESR